MASSLTQRPFFLSSGITIRQGPSFFTQRLSISQESEQYPLISEGWVDLRQSNNHSTAIGSFHQQTVGKAFALYGFCKRDSCLLQHAFERHSCKVHRSRGVLRDRDLRMGQAFKVCATQNLLSGISLNAQLLRLEDCASESEQQAREQ